MSFRQSLMTCLLAAALLLTAGLCRADSGGGSGYSRYGIGDLRYFSNPRAMGMGGAGIAVLSPQTIDLSNPALWSVINRTRFSAAGMYEGFSSTDFSGSSYLSRTHMGGISLAVPVEHDNGITISAGASPYSRVNYDMVTPASQSGLDYMLTYLGDGGLSLGHLGISGKIGNDLYLGTKLNYYFGTLSYTMRQTFSTGDYTTAEVTRATHYSGTGGTFGLVFSGLGNLFGLESGSSLNIAALLNTTSYLTASDQRYSTFNSGTVLAQDTVSYPDGTLRLPYSVTVGAAYQTEKVTVAIDYTYQKGSELALNGAPSPELRDSRRFGAGIELLPKREYLSPFFQRVAYRAGFYYNETYYQIRNTAINEFGITGGLGIPVFGDTRIGLAAEYAFRGTTDLQLQKDKILRISFTLDIGELWFQHPPED